MSWYDHLTWGVVRRCPGPEAGNTEDLDVCSVAFDRLRRPLPLRHSVARDLAPLSKTEAVSVAEKNKAETRRFAEEKVVMAQKMESGRREGGGRTVSHILDIQTRLLDFFLAQSPDTSVLNAVDCHHRSGGGGARFTPVLISLLHRMWAGESSKSDAEEEEPSAEIGDADVEESGFLVSPLPPLEGRESLFWLLLSRGASVTVATANPPPLHLAAAVSSSDTVCASLVAAVAQGQKEVAEKKDELIEVRHELNLIFTFLIYVVCIFSVSGSVSLALFGSSPSILWVQNHDSSSRQCERGRSSGWNPEVERNGSSCKLYAIVTDISCLSQFTLSTPHPPLIIFSTFSSPSHLISSSLGFLNISGRD